MTVHLTIHKCKECPKHFVWRDDDHNIVRRCNLAMTHIPDPQTIPTWCPLRKERMIRYIEWGEKIGRVLDGYATEGCVDIDPSNPDSLRAFWSALPADLRLALAKTAPKAWEPWERAAFPEEVWARFNASRTLQIARIEADGVDFAWTVFAATNPRGSAGTLAEAQSACDAELIRQGYVLDDGGEV